MVLAAAALCLWGCTAIVKPAADEQLVILHTNDTHSHIDPEPDGDIGGVARRKVLIDSIRKANPNVLLVDAGDIVQGTLYFHLYKGAVEQQVLNELGYDVQILGNHEFDNGTESLARMLSKARPALLSSNYDLSESALAGMFKPYIVKQYGSKKVGIFAINLDPKGMVAEGNYDGVKFLPWRQSAQAAIDSLRIREKADYVIALTHIGYSGSDEDPALFGDVQLAEQTRGIDLIIGGHSHTLLDPAVKVADLDGDSVTIVQTGKYGRNLGEINVDLKSGKTTEKIIPVDSRLDSRRDPQFMAMLEPYRSGIDSLYSHTVARVESAEPLDSKNKALWKFAADFVRATGERLAPGVQAAISNKGGLRTTWKPGDLSEGAVIDMMPFYNKVVVLDIKGSDLKEAFDVMEARGGDAVSGITDPDHIDPGRTYRIATIDYLAKGGDYMAPLTRGTIVAESPRVAYDDMLEYLKSHPVIKPDDQDD